MHVYVVACMPVCSEAKPRKVVSGIAEFFKPDQIIGKLVVIMANLKGMSCTCCNVRSL